MDYQHQREVDILTIHLDYHSHILIRRGYSQSIIVESRVGTFMVGNDVGGVAARLSSEKQPWQIAPRLSQLLTHTPSPNGLCLDLHPTRPKTTTPTVRIVKSLPTKAKSTGVTKEFSSLPQPTTYSPLNSQQPRSPHSSKIFFIRRQRQLSDRKAKHSASIHLKTARAP